VDAIFFIASPAPGASTQTDEVAATVHGGTLNLRRSAVTLTLRRAGTQADFRAERPSPTPG
jgi:hypothetical protein